MTYSSLNTMNRQDGKLKFALVCAAALAGLLQTWANRFYIEPDGLNYLDITYAYLRRDWPNAINALWSPLYSWILAAAIGLTHISLPLESTLLHIVNFVLYLVALACFAFFFEELSKWRAAVNGSQATTDVQDAAWLIWGYALFAYCTLELIGVGSDRPDIIVAAVTFLASGLLLRMRRNEAGWLVYAAFGVVLGLGYLAKSIMFPLGFVLVFCALFARKPDSRQLARAGLAVACFLVISAPWILVLSRAQHRLTFGDAGRLNYAYYVNGLNDIPHWHGEIPGAGVPIHPTRRIHDAPPVDEFATPVAGTYPPWYDPTYWNDGVIPHFEFRGQLRTIGENAGAYFHTFSAQRSIAVGLLVLLIFLRKRFRFLRNFCALWIVWLPALATLVLYVLVHVETRYVSAAIVVFWCCLFASVCAEFSPPEDDFPRVCRAVLLAMATILGITLFTQAAGDLVRGYRASNSPLQVAMELQKHGLQPGERVAVLGHDTSSDYWAHLAQVRIIADVPEQNLPAFRDTGDETRSRIYAALANQGVDFVVTHFRPPTEQSRDWQSLGTTGYYVLPLGKEAKPE